MKAKPPAPARKPPGRKSSAAAKRGAKHAKVVDELLEQVASKLKENDAKATLGDYIRLVQLQKELDEDEQPREIKVTWIEPPAVMAEVERELAEMQDAEPVEPKLREKPAVEKSENEA